MTQRRQILREIQKSDLDPSLNYVVSKGKLVPKKAPVPLVDIETKKPEDDKKTVTHQEKTDNVVVEQQVIDTIVSPEDNSSPIEETVTDTPVEIVEDTSLSKKTKKKK